MSGSVTTAHILLGVLIMLSIIMERAIASLMTALLHPVYYNLKD